MGDKFIFVPRKDKKLFKKFEYFTLCDYREYYRIVKLLSGYCGELWPILERNEFNEIMRSNNCNFLTEKQKNIKKKFNGWMEYIEHVKLIYLPDVLIEKMENFNNRITLREIDAEENDS